MKNLADLPATKEYMQQFAGIAFEPVLRGQSNLLISIPNSGTNSLIKYLLGYAENVDSKLAKAIAEYNIIYLNLRGVEKIESIWEQMAGELGLKTENKDFKKSVIAELTKLTRGNLLLIINGLENIFLDKDVQTEITNLFADLSLVQVLAIAYGDLPHDQLNYIATNYRITNTNFIPLRTVKDMKILIEKEERWFDYEVSKAVKQKIINLAGGYSAFARVMLSLAQKDEHEFLSASPREIATNPQMRIWQDQVYQSLSVKAKEEIKALLFQNQEIIKNEYLLNTGIVASNNNIFSLLFSEYIASIIKENILIKEKAGELYINEYNLKKLFTNQEYLILKAFWQNRNNIISREQLAQVMWGSKIDSYSDWAIDKIISKIRDKLFDKEKKIILTIKGKGFILKQD